MASPAPKASKEVIVFDPNKTELERLHLQHVLIKDHMKDLVVAPIDLSKPGLRILDQATADGLWLQDVRNAAVAEHEYVGTDIADSFFPASPPPNMSFYHQSMTEPWPQPWSHSFDLVHSRFALAGVGTMSVHSVLANLVDLVKPGGYVQFVEIDIEERPGNEPAMRTFRQLFVELLRVISGGKGMDFRTDVRVFLNDRGFEDVEERIYGVPIGAKAADEEMSRIGVESVMLTVHGLVGFLSQLPNAPLSAESMQSLLTDLPKELREIGGTFQFFTIWGRKPIQAS